MELYPSMAEHSGRAVLPAIRHPSAEGNGPVLVHCASGKDRTGVVVALVQTLFGASEAEVVGDFLRSNAELRLPVTQPTGPRGHNTLPVAAGTCVARSCGSAATTDLYPSTSRLTAPQRKTSRYCPRKHPQPTCQPLLLDLHRVSKRHALTSSCTVGGETSSS
ncbi:tyrosine-protein phosphatase [Streptomyces anulatus]|uniref:tyrosine-protein phosphatase n=1 Tax=Streptomyces anulatus TaxID=1892 RepID=UPI0034162406